MERVHTLLRTYEDTEFTADNDSKNDNAIMFGFMVPLQDYDGRYEGDETQVDLDPALANDLRSSISSGTCTIPDSRLSINGLRYGRQAVRTLRNTTT